MQRVANWPPGITPPRKVRVYRRNDHWVLQWWESRERKNVAERVDGDFIAAVGRAREIDQRLLEFKRSGHAAGRAKLKHAELVQRFLTDLEGRSNAGQVEPRSVVRYRSALTHYQAFAAQATVQRQYPYVAGVDRQFALAFGTFLAGREVAPNGSAGAARRRMKGGAFVWDAARAMFAWAADPDRGRLLGDGFRNPFARRAGDRSQVASDPFGEGDVTIEMAAQLLAACDAYQLPLFGVLVFYGLRASEPAFLFGEYIEGVSWLSVPCNERISYTTKGKRPKRLPLVEPLASLLAHAKPGLLFVRRSVFEGTEQPPLLGFSLEELASEFQRRLRNDPVAAGSAAGKQRIRDKLLKEAGGLTYDDIEGEFKKLAGKLGWPPAAALKDLRHLFATSLAAAGMSEPYRKYLMGHAFSAGAIGAYTHLPRIREQYQTVLQKEWPSLVQAVHKRLHELSKHSPAASVLSSSREDAAEAS